MTGGLTANNDSKSLETSTMGHQYCEVKQHVTTTKIMIGCGYIQSFVEVLQRVAKGSSGRKMVAVMLINGCLFPIAKVLKYLN